MKNEYKVIDSNTYELIDSENMIIANNKIADTIRILNKKGYFVKEFDCGELRSYHMIKNLIPYINKEANKQNLLLLTLLTSIFIVFEKNYNFENIPEGYDVVENPKGLLCQIKYYQNDEVTNLKEFEEILNEQNKYLILLNDWAKELPERKDD